MKLSLEQIEIPVEKVIQYLLVKKPKNDKSAFLNRLGYNETNVQRLIQDIKQLAIENEAELSRVSEYGDLYKITGKLKEVLIVSIWLEQIEENKFRFVTLYPL